MDGWMALGIVLLLVGVIAVWMVRQFVVFKGD